MAEEHSETEDLLRRAGTGDPAALGDLFTRHRERLARMIRLRMDRRLQGRLDASDVLQEAYLEYSQSLADYLRARAMPFYLWLRTVAGRKLFALHRRHLGAAMRDAGREVSLNRGDMPEASSDSLVEHLLGSFTSPSQAVLRVELQVRVQDALNGLEPLDREILALRHFERLTNAEAARVLELGESAASNRFVRALKRLKKRLADVPGLFDQPPRPAADGGA